LQKTVNPAVEVPYHADSRSLRPIEPELHETITRDGCHGTTSLF